MEANDHRAVIADLDCLTWMKLELPGDRGGLGAEPPHDVYRFLFIDAERRGNEFAQVEIGITIEAVGKEPQLRDLRQAVEPNCRGRGPRRRVLVLQRYQIVAVAIEKPKL